MVFGRCMRCVYTIPQHRHLNFIRLEGSRYLTRRLVRALTPWSFVVVGHHQTHHPNIHPQDLLTNAPSRYNSTRPSLYCTLSLHTTPSSSPSFLGRRAQAQDELQDEPGTTTAIRAIPVIGYLPPSTSLSEPANRTSREGLQRMNVRSLGLKGAGEWAQ